RRGPQATALARAAGGTAGLRLSEHRATEREFSHRALARPGPWWLLLAQHDDLVQASAGDWNDWERRGASGGTPGRWSTTTGCSRTGTSWSRKRTGTRSCSTGWRRRPRRRTCPPTLTGTWLYSTSPLVRSGQADRFI